MKLTIEAKTPASALDAASRVSGVVVIEVNTELAAEIAAAIPAPDDLITALCLAINLASAKYPEQADVLIRVLPDPRPYAIRAAPKDGAQG